MVENFIREYGLWAVLFGTMLEGELTLLFAGVLAHYGLFSFGEVVCCGTLGGFISDAACYLFGFTSKQSIRNLSFIKKAQPRLEKLCQRFGVFSIFLVKYIYGMRMAAAMFCGFAQMRLRRFAPLTFASCMVWVGLLAGTGYFFSGAIEILIGQVQQIGMILLIGVLVTLLVTVIVYFIDKYYLIDRIPELGVLGLREPCAFAAVELSEPVEGELIPLCAQSHPIAKTKRAA